MSSEFSKKHAILAFISFVLVAFLTYVSISDFEDNSLVYISIGVTLAAVVIEVIITLSKNKFDISYTLFTIIAVYLVCLNIANFTI